MSRFWGVFLLVTALVLGGCGDARPASDPSLAGARQGLAAPTLTGFTPTSGGASTTLTLTGSGLTGTRVVRVNGVATSFTVISDTQVSAQVPEGATSGPLFVLTDAGSVTSSSSFTVIPGPELTALSPQSGAAGTTVTFIGKNLTGARNVSFAGVYTPFTVVDGTRITATVPLGAKTGPVYVSTPGGSLFQGTFTVLGSTAPTLTDFSPASGGEGTSITLTGTNFTGASSVSFNGIGVRSFNLTSDTQLTVNVPTGASTGRIRVSNSRGEGLSSTDFTVLPAPRVSSFTPASGPAGTVITVSGSGFTGASEVRLGNTSLSVFTVKSDTQLTATVPTGVLSGTLRVTAPGGQATSTSSFLVQSGGLPTLTSVSPNSGGVGTSVTLTGGNFTGTTEVSFNGTPATSFSLSGDTRLFVDVPSGATSGPLRVVNTSGAVVSATPFTMPAAPSLTGFSPTSGEVGTVVTITGGGFGATTSVRFGSEYAKVTVLSATQLTALVPPKAQSGRLQLSVGGQPLTSTESFTVLGGTVPTVNRLFPASGDVSTQVVIDGSYFTGVSRVEFNGVAASYFYLTSDGRLSAPVPFGASTGPIRVVTSAGTGTSSTPFTVLSSPSVTGFSPARGPVGTTVTLTGTGFTRARSVWFDTLDATFMVDSDTQMRVIVPPGARTGRLLVWAGYVSYSAGEFVVESSGVPSIRSISPSAGGVDTYVTLYGSGLAGTTRVSFNGIPASYITASTEGTLSVLVPPGATSGPIQVTNTVGSATSGTSFTVLAPPSVTGLSPASGAVGTRVTLAGTGFTGVSSVRFGWAYSSRIEVLSDTQMTVEVPPGAVSGPVVPSGAAGSAVTSVNFTVSGACAPFITEFSPDSGGPDSIYVTLRGGCFTGASQVLLNGTPARFSMYSDDSLSFWVPEGATSGPISVRNSMGTATTSRPFTVVPRPVISSISPTSGPPGTQVTLTGTGLAGTFWASVTDGGLAPYTVIDDTRVVVTLPSGTRSGPILLLTHGGTVISTQSFTVQSVSTPTLTGFAPARGGPGTRVELDGSGFTGVTEVRFNGVKVELFTYTTGDSKLFVAVPVGATTGPITVVNTLGTATSSSSFIVDAGSSVSLSGISPARAAVGATVELSGTNLSGCQALFPNLTMGAQVLSNTGTKMRVVVPEGAMTGNLHVRCATGAAWIGFELQAPPRLMGLNPASGPSTGGTRVSLTGSGFESGATVSFGGEAASAVTVVDEAHLSATTPAHAVGVVDVVVLNPSGSRATLGGAFTYERGPAPGVTGLAPGSGPTRGGSALTLTGSGFVTGARVSLGGVDATDVMIINANTLTATAPAHAAGVVDVAVINPDGQSGVLARGFAYLAPPTLSSLNPTQGMSNGNESVIISGSGFRAGVKVRFGGVEATAVFLLSDTSLQAFTPVHAPGVVEVQVENPDGQSVTRGGGFTYLASPGPFLTGVSPNTGLSSGGESFTLTGGGFVPGTTVSMGGANATNITVLDANTLTGRTPAHAPGGVDVVVRNPDGQTATLGGAFTYSLSPAPAVTDLGPREGTSNGGTRIFLTGRSFVPGLTVLVGGVPATEVYLNDATSLAATTPAHAPGGVDVVVRNPDGQTGTLESGFTYVAAPAPSVSGISPGSGPSTGGTRVTLTGNHFAPGATVLIGGASATEVTWVSANTLTATTSARAAGTVDVVVRNPDGQAATLPGAYTYVPVPAPTLAAINPAHGPATGGTRVTLTGEHFEPGAQVLLGGIVATAVSVSSATSLAATTPAHAPGKVDVVVRNADGQGATLTGAFTYDVPPPPTVGSVAPASGLSTGGGRVTVSGTGFGPGASVRFGGVAASDVTVTSDTSLSANLPAHAPGRVDVVVRNADGQEGTLLGGFTYEAAPAPTLVGLSPTKGVSTGETVVTLSGTGFAPGASVTFGGVTATRVQVASPSSLTATTPVHAVGPVDVTITNADGQGATSRGAFTYEAAPPPTLSSLTPSRGPTAGGTSVTLRGTGFVSGTTVRFGGVAATSVSVASGGSLSAITPAHESGRVDVEVLNPDGSRASLAGGFLYEQSGPPVVSSVSPNTGSTSGGTVLTISGSNFAPNARVTLAGVDATNVVVASPTSITATTPPNRAGTVDVFVLHPDGSNGRLVGGFTYREQVPGAEGCGGCAGLPGVPGAAPLLLLGLVLRLRRRSSPR